ncbi:glycosyltransferase [Paenibacillus donghaensis]|uniref:CgeB family protein n=1 Tax=Paenibacillus donghaensis TaxID=414771 RepID=UPI0018845CE1|nr:glycosyltransferase [Paenibacillus donghaensis]MBE9915162.1 glycosyltransferase [Paenibacillus donghaensis]
MKVLFLESNPVWIHTLPEGFRDAGHQVEISGALTQDNIPSIIESFSPNLIITMGWGPEQTEEKQLWIREHVKASGIPHVYWATEDPNFTSQFTLPLIERMQPDFVFTISSKKVKWYRERGIKADHLDFAYHPSVHRKTKPRKKYRRSIAVVANAYPEVLKQYPRHYRNQSIRTLIRPLIKQGIRVDFYGRDWDKMKPFLGENIPHHWIHGYLPYEEAYKVYNSSAIMIGLQNYADMVTQRTYEILGSGGFVLTSNTAGVRRLLTPGKDLIVSSSPKETLRLVRYYLKRKKLRERIKRQGRLTIAPQNYKQRAQKMIAVLKQNHIIG